jgi:hypothetical protein
MQTHDVLELFNVFHHSLNFDFPDICSSEGARVLLINIPQYFKFLTSIKHTK